MSRAPLAIAAALLALTFAGCSDDSDSSEGSSKATDSGAEREATGVECEYQEDPAGASKPADLPPTDATVSGEVPVTFETSVGTFNATLDADTTPCTVNSFVSLADQGYFDGTSCHRMTTSGIYVLQCGDPSGTGAGGPGYSFADELSDSDTYGPGTLAMANAGPNTNGSQFFIVFDDSPLPPSYTVFGSVDDDTVNLITDVATEGTNEQNGPGDGAPNTPVDIESVTAE